MITTVFGTAAPGGPAPIWSIRLPQAGSMEVTAGGTANPAPSEFTLQVTTDPPIQNKSLMVTHSLPSPNIQQWEQIFGVIVNALNIQTDSSGVLSAVVSRQQLYDALYINPGTPPGYPQAQMDFQIQVATGSLVPFQIQLIAG